MLKKSLWVLLILWMSPLLANEASDALQNKLNAMKTMSASFKQVIRGKQRDISKASGTMALARPGRFRWQTKAPMEQLVIADGKHLWIYDVDLEQVTVKKQDKSLGGTAALFLSGYDESLAQDFKVERREAGSTSFFDLHATSNKANFQRVKLAFVGEELRGIELFDQLGQHTEVMLTHIKNNPNLQASLFQFEPPKGVDVVNQ